jgi:excisionase family DNA binding protein
VVSVREISEMLGMSDFAVRRAIFQGRLPARKWGAKVVVFKNDLDRYLSSLPRAKGKVGK